jgi:hypothetical protein
MALDMALVQLLASIVAGAIGYGLAKSGKAVWRPILGFVLGWVVGWIAGFALGVAFFKGDSAGVQMRAMGTTFWMALIFSGVGVFLGRKKLKNSDSPAGILAGSNSDMPVISSTTQATTTNLQPLQTGVTAETNHKMAVSITSPSAQSNNMSSNTFDDDHFYEVVANELETGNTEKGLWTRLYAEHDGDEKKIKIAYIKQRAEKLITVERTRLQEVAQAQAAALAEKERLRGLSVKARVMERIQRGETKLLPADKFLHAVRCGDIESISRLLREDEMYVAVVDSGTRNTALHIALAEKNGALARLLIQSGASVSVTNAYGLSPVDFAQENPALMAVLREEGVS